jgi:hypothetical protein
LAFSSFQVHSDSIVENLSLRKFLLYRNNIPGNTNGNIGIDSNSNGTIDERELVKDADNDGSIGVGEIFEFIIGNNLYRSKLEGIARAIWDSDDIDQYFDCNKTLAIDVIKQMYYSILKFISILDKALLGDKEFVLAAVTQDYRAFQYASERM